MPTNTRNCRLKTRWWIRAGVLLAAVHMIGVGFAPCAQEPVASPTIDSRLDRNASSPGSDAGEVDRVAVSVARDRAQIMHEIYAATLDVMHHRYFHGQRAIVPARAMEDVFAALKRQSQVEARWISVNVKAMSINHEPESDFEKTAAREIAAGKPDVEAIEDGFYRRAGAIAMTAGCVGCHEGFGKKPSPEPKFAALVISIPVHSESSQPD